MTDRRKDSRAAFGEFGLAPACSSMCRSGRRRPLFGHVYAAPFGIAPLGMSALYAYRGDLVLVRAASVANIPMILSGSSLIRLNEPPCLPDRRSQAAKRDFRTDHYGRSARLGRYVPSPGN